MSMKYRRFYFTVAAISLYYATGSKIHTTQETDFFAQEVHGVSKNSIDSYRIFFDQVTDAVKDVVLVIKDALNVFVKVTQEKQLGMKKVSNWCSVVRVDDD